MADLGSIGFLADARLSVTSATFSSPPVANQGVSNYSSTSDVPAASLSYTTVSNYFISGYYAPGISFYSRGEAASSSPSSSFQNVTGKRQGQPDLLGAITGVAKINNVVAPYHKVWLYDRTTRQLAAIVRADLNGYFSFNNLLPNCPRYQVRIQQDGADVGNFNVSAFDNISAS